VAPLAGDEVGTYETPAADHDARAYARAEDDTEHNVGPGARAVRGLRQREAIRIVHEPYRSPKVSLEVSAEGLAVQPERVGVLDEACLRNDRPRDADAYGPRSPLFPSPTAGALDVEHQVNDGIDQWLVRAGSIDASPDELPSIVTESDRLDLRSTEIYADTHARFASA
jgi:hypothetical protein